MLKKGFLILEGRGQEIISLLGEIHKRNTGGVSLGAEGTASVKAQSRGRPGVSEEQPENLGVWSPVSWG